MVILDKYDDVTVTPSNLEDGTYYDVLVGVESNVDPTISDIASEVNQDNVLFYNGFYGLILDVSVDTIENNTKIIIKTRRIDR